MENRSQDNPNRRHRGNRTGGRSRNRQGNQSNSGAGNRSRNRSRSGSGSRRAPKQSAWQKFLSAVTFGLLGKPKATKKSRSGSDGARSDAQPQRSGAGNPRKTNEESKKPKRNRAEVTSRRLYVGNLDYTTGETELEELFRGVGNVLSSEVVTNPRTQQSKGFAFVEMGSIEEAKRAVSVLDDQDFMGRKLIVSGARSEDSAMAESTPESVA